MIVLITKLILGLQLPIDTSAKPQTMENTTKTRETQLHTQNTSWPMPVPPHSIPTRGSPKLQPPHSKKRPPSTYLTDSQPQDPGHQEMDRADWLRLSISFLSSSPQAHCPKQHNQQSSNSTTTTLSKYKKNQWLHALQQATTTEYGMGQVEISDWHSLRIAGPNLLRLLHKANQHHTY